MDRQQPDPAASGDTGEWMAEALHVSNGDATDLAGTGITRRTLFWRDVLHEGPVPAVGPEELRRIRATFLVQANADDRGEATAMFAERDRTLEANRDGEYLLWFEADLYDQLQIIQILARLADLGVPAQRITLICIGEHPGIARFGGLGQLTAEQLRALPATNACARLTPAALHLATRAWAAFRAPTPGGLGAIAATRSPDLRFLGEAFDRLSREYRATRDGLSLTERRVLAAVANGVPDADTAFVRATARETRPYLGDTWCFAIMDRLAGGPVRLLRVEPADRPVHRTSRLRLTGAGSRVLAGEADHVTLNGLDRWIGGVHLSGRQVPGAGMTGPNLSPDRPTMLPRTMTEPPPDLLRRVGLDPAASPIEDVAHNRWLTAGIWRVSTPGGIKVLKHLSATADPGDTPMTAHWTAGSESITHWNYWAREGLAYLHGLTGAFADGGIGAPELLAVDRTDSDLVLLLEFVAGVPAGRWAIDDYARASVALGRAQGSYVSVRPAPRYPWLSHGFLSDYSTEKPVDWSLLFDDRAWAQPLVRDNFPPELRAAAIWLHESRERLYSIAEGLPRTLCHLDFWTKNLIRRTDGSFALLDWAFVGDGAIGEDVGNLVPDAVLDHFVPAAEFPALEAAVRYGYLEGLEKAGWVGDPRLVELGMWASAVKYDWLTPMMLASASAPVQRGYGGVDEIDADHRFRERGLALLHNAESARRAVALADEMGFGG